MHYIYTQFLPNISKHVHIILFTKKYQYFYLMYTGATLAEGHMSYRLLLMNIRLYKIYKINLDFIFNLFIYLH